MNICIGKSFFNKLCQFSTSPVFFTTLSDFLRHAYSCLLRSQLVRTSQKLKIIKTNKNQLL